MATVWNPSDHSTHITLSNSNHTVTASSGASNEGARAFGVSHSSGKWYLEYSIISDASDPVEWGFGTFTDPFGVAVQFGVSTDFMEWPAGSGSVLLPSSSVGKTVGFAVDLSAGLWW